MDYNVLQVLRFGMGANSFISSYDIGPLSIYQSLPKRRIILATLTKCFFSLYQKLKFHDL